MIPKYLVVAVFSVILVLYNSVTDAFSIPNSNSLLPVSFGMNKELNLNSNVDLNGMNKELNLNSNMDLNGNYEKKTNYDIDNNYNYNNKKYDYDIDVSLSNSNSVSSDESDFSEDYLMRKEKRKQKLAARRERKEKKRAERRQRLLERRQQRGKYYDIDYSNRATSGNTINEDGGLHGSFSV